MKKYLVPMILLILAGPASGEVVEMVTLAKYVFRVNKTDLGNIKITIIRKTEIGDDECLLTVAPETAKLLAKELLEAAK